MWFAGGCLTSPKLSYSQLFSCSSYGQQWGWCTQFASETVRYQTAQPIAQPIASSGVPSALPSCLELPRNEDPGTHLWQGSDTNRILLHP